MAAATQTRSTKLLWLGFVTALVIGGSTLIPRSVHGQELTESRRVRIARRLAQSTVSVICGPATGSGFVVGRERWVITNNHVVESSQMGVQVRFGSGTTMQARVLRIDPTHDLAILEVVGRVTAPPLEFTDSDSVEVGHTVLAFGSPYGLEGTLTEGIVSAWRELPDARGGLAHRLIQTDAPINPGNSGGPLVDRQGRVVGVNTAIYSRTGGSDGIGFAVPSNYVRQFIEATRDELTPESPSPNSGGVGSQERITGVREPQELAGFQLGWSTRQAEEACTGAGHEWSPVVTLDEEGPHLGAEMGSCDGPVAGIGIDVGLVNVLLREGRVVALLAAHHAQDVGPSLLTLFGLLQSRYGEPVFSGVEAEWCRSGSSLEAQVRCYLSPTALGTGGQLVVTFPSRALVELRARQILLRGRRVNFVTLTYATADERRRFTDAIIAREAERPRESAPPTPSL